MLQWQCFLAGNQKSSLLLPGPPARALSEGLEGHVREQLWEGGESQPWSQGSRPLSSPFTSQEPPCQAQVSLSVTVLLGIKGQEQILLNRPF